MLSKQQKRKYNVIVVSINFSKDTKIYAEKEKSDEHDRSYFHRMIDESEQHIHDGINRKEKEAWTKVRDKYYLMLAKVSNH